MKRHSSSDRNTREPVSFRLSPEKKSREIIASSSSIGSKERATLPSLGESKILLCSHFELIDAHRGPQLILGPTGKHSSNIFNKELTASLYASTFRLLTSERKSRESITGTSASASKNSPFSSKAILSPSIYLKKALKQMSGPLNRRRSSLPESSGPSPPNVMEFLIDVCPEDVLPKILAFAGPQKTAALSKVNRVWRDVIAEEWTWRVLCENLYKWTPDQPEPVSWKDYYMKNPVVPTDYPSIHAALAIVSNSSKKNPHESGNVRILIRPGRYYMPEAVTVRATRRTTQITVQAMKLPETCMLDDTSLAVSDWGNRRVTLVSKTGLRNEPLFRVLCGELVLRNLCLEHKSIGIDIWSGNAAIHVRPDNRDTTYRPRAVLAEAAAVLETVDVVSHSGRGVVVLDGAHVRIKDSYIHDCAATGVYVGGHGSRAVLETVDVTENGKGNHRVGGIAKGHSGIYIDQGVVSITDCNVSQNSASGVSVISPDLTELTLTKTDILTNGNRPIDVHVESLDRLDINPDCNLAVIGLFNPRSTILAAERADDESEADLTEF